MMHNKRVSGLFGNQHEVLAKLDSDCFGFEQLEYLGAILKVGAGGVSEAISAAAIALMKQLFDGSGILAAETQFLAHVFMPIFGQTLGRFDAETV